MANLVKNNMRQFEGALVAAAGGDPSILAETDLHAIKNNLLILTHIESMVVDCQHGDIPYFSANICTGELSDSRGQLLAWDGEKVKMELMKLGINEQTREELFSRLDALPSPLEHISRRIEVLGRDFVSHHGDIKMCEAYQSSVSKLDLAFEELQKIQPELYHSEKLPQNIGQKMAAVILGFLSFLFLINLD